MIKAKYAFKTTNFMFQHKNITKNVLKPIFITFNIK